MSDSLIVGEGGLDYNLEGLLRDSRTNGDALASNAFNATIPQGEYLLLDALARLNDIGAGINALTGGDASGVEATLRLIVESAIKVVPGASAVLYTFDARRGAFDPVSRVSAGEWLGATPEERARIEDDEPRASGLGMRAVGRLGPVLSYEEPSLDIHPAKLKDILLYHGVAGNVMAADAAKLTSADTVLGKPIAIKVKDDKVMINDSTVIIPDVKAGNGVIHVIDSVMLPPSK